MKAYNGHRSWNAWNVSLWINNDESVYRWARELTREGGRARAARLINQELGGTKTPDGAVYNRTAIYLALEEIA